MVNKIPALIAAALILGSASAASAAPRRAVVLDDSAAYAVPAEGGYSLDPQTRALERLADKYDGWAEYIR